MNKKYLSLKEIQQTSLEVLKVIHNVCEKKGFRYFLYNGTLLGAIRHKAIIPWDDDIDIAMPRPDYIKFCQYCKEHSEELKPFKLYNLDTVEGYPYMISRMSDDRYKLEVENEKDYGIGLFVDIYPFDGLGNDYESAFKTMTRLRKYPRLIFLSTRLYYHFGITKGWGKRFLKIGAFCFAKLVGKEYFMKRMMSMVDTDAYETSRYIGCAVWGSGSKVCIWDKQKLGELTFVDFENGKFRSFAEYDYFLTTRFGDYMKLPPEEERVPHHLYKAYKK